MQKKNMKRAIFDFNDLKKVETPVDKPSTDVGANLVVAPQTHQYPG
ncbi:MAG: hypothetical protein PVH61_27775 [Candidatus Aminicenantes bacterium]|jgi:hypothetical protein